GDDDQPVDRQRQQVRGGVLFAVAGGHPGNHLHLDTVLRAHVNDALLVPRIHPRQRHRGVLAGHLFRHDPATVVSCTPAAVTSTTNNRPSTSVATCRFLPLIFLPASIPCECSGTLLDVLTVCAARIAAVGSGLRPAASRTLPRNMSWIAS